MKTYIHIGLEKTGTTSIQLFFTKNRKKLKQCGFYYPKSIGTINHHDLAYAAYMLSRKVNHTKSNSLKSEEDIKKAHAKIIKNLHKEIRRIPNDFTLICSSEHIQSRLTTIDEVENLEHIFKSSKINDIKIILYIRNPAELANSLYSTAVKSGSTDSFVPPPHHNYYKNVCDHQSTIKRFGSVFGYKNLIIRLYRSDRFVNGSLLEDIALQIGLNNISNFVIPNKQNESLSLLGIEVLRRINIKLKDIKPVEAQKYRNRIIPVLQQYFSQPKYSMPKKLYEQYDTYFAESNEWVRSNYFPEEERLFNSDYPAESNLEIPEQELVNIANFIQEMIDKKGI